MAKEVKTPEEYAAEMKAVQAAAEKASADAKAEIAELEKKTEAAKAEFKEAKEAAELATKTAADMTEKVEKLVARMDIKTEPKEEMSLETAIENALESKEWKDGARKVLESKGSFTMEVKIATTDVTTPVARTFIDPEIGGAGRFPNSILDIFNRRTIPANKNRIGYREASYIDATGYASEMTALVQANNASMNEKYREVAKLGNFTVFSTEMLEDYSELVDWTVNEAKHGITSKINMLLKEGNGSDTTKPNEIYSVKSGSKAFDAVASGVKVEHANVADLVRAAITQIKKQGKAKYRPTHVVMSTATLESLRLEKTTTKEYLMNPALGTEMVHGLVIVEDPELNDNEMYVLSKSTLNIYEKRTLQLVVEFKAEIDATRYFLWWRGNSLIREMDKVGNVYIANIETALASITKTEA